MTGKQVIDHPTHLSVKQAAAKLGVSPEFIRDRIADGSLPAYKAGRIIRIKPDDLDKVLVRIPAA